MSILNECVGLTLKTTTINADTAFATYFGTTINTDKGIISNNRTNFTWYNINLRKILGAMYDKYETFNICLNSFAMSTQGTTYTYADTRVVYIKLSGLPFTNGAMENVMNVVQIPYVASTGFATSFNSPQFYTFNKSTESINISIKLNSIVQDDFDVYTVATDLMGHTSYLFNIYGVEQYDRPDKSKNAQHIIIK